MKQEKSLRLKSGHPMPVLGLGTWMLSGKRCEEVVRKALELGYTHIDTAEFYDNEEEIGRAIDGFERSELFITSKVWRTNLRLKDTITACEKTLKRLGTSYVDLYLIHWPNDGIPIAETMKAMKELVDRGMVRSVGISNFDTGRTREAIEASEIPVNVNQVEFHPHLYQKELLEFCKKNGVILTAYCPLARGDVLSDRTITEIAGRCGKTPAQVSLKWLVQHGAVVIPKSSSVEHLRDNMGIFGWQLSEGDMRRIDSIGIHKRKVNPFFTRIPLFRNVLDKLR